MRLFVASAPGLEPLLADELRELGFVPTVYAGGVEVDADLASTYRLLLTCRLGLSVRLRLARFRSTHFAHLDKRLGELTWRKWLPMGEPVAVRAHARGSRLYHTGGIAERVRRALGAALGAGSTPSPEQPDTAREQPVGGGLTLHARMDRDHLTLSVDLCGEALHRRGYRKQVGKAPLREDLAAALLRLGGYDGRIPLVDPLCGAGTLVIEAALIATGTAPGRDRRFALERLPMHAADVLARVRAKSTSVPAGERAPAAIVGSDRDKGAIAAATANAQRAGMTAALRLACQPLSACPLPGPGPAERGLIVANPPYGNRIGRRGALRNLYASLGALRHRAGPGFRLALITSEPALAHATGLKLTPACLTDLGGTKVRLYHEPE